MGQASSTIEGAGKSYLKVDGNKITLDGKRVLLKGAGLGGWMNMENFITGYPGHEHEVRAALKKVLGEDKYEFFFDKFLEYFFTEADAKFFSSLGLNCLRLPVNYRHFEDDMNPGKFKKSGLKHLDRVIDLCAKHGIYTVIDLHAAPGGQNPDWHCDTGYNHALFWVHKDFQDRTVKIWEELARHYRNNRWVAGYNPINEPTDVEHTRLTAFYARAEKAIRAVDPHHILFLDGNSFGSDFSHFGAPLPNAVYTCHDYSAYGFPNPPETFEGTPDQIKYHERQFAQRIAYMKQNDGAIWNGEFGPVYQQASDGVPDWEKINRTRYAVLKCQLGVYAAENASWSIWLYKDIGFQGMVYVGEDTAYRRLIAPFLTKKKALAVDAWGNDTTPIQHIFDPMEKWLDENCELNAKYPWDTRAHLARAVRQTLMSEVLCDEFAAYFADKSKEDLEELAASFKLENCTKRKELNQILEEDGRRGDLDDYVVL